MRSNAIAENAMRRILTAAGERGDTISGIRSAARQSERGRHEGLNHEPGNVSVLAESFADDVERAIRRGRKSGAVETVGAAGGKNTRYTLTTLRTRGREIRREAADRAALQFATKIVAAVRAAESDGSAVRFVMNALAARQ